MPSTRFRPTIRFLMAVVAVAAIPMMAFQTWKLMELRRFYQEEAAEHNKKGIEELEKVAICREVRKRGTDFDPRYLTAHAALFSELVGKHGVRPRFRQSLGHNHVSQLLSVGTVDTSVSREILDFIDDDVAIGRKPFRHFRKGHACRARGADPTVVRCPAGISQLKRLGY